MLSMVLWYDTWDRENGGIIMRRDRVLSGGVYALKAVWDDLYALNPPAVFLLLGSLCTVFLYAWGSSKIALVMLFCTAFSYLVGRCVRGWGRVLLGSVFLLFMVVITLASILIGFLLCFDFSPAIRFEPGEEREVSLIDFGGKRRIFGFNNKVNDYLDRK